MSQPSPTVYDQIRALYGVRDILATMALAELNKDAPNLQNSLELLVVTLSIATTVLDETLQGVGAGSAANVHDRPTHESKGFPAMLDTGAVAEKITSVSVSN